MSNIIVKNLEIIPIQSNERFTSFIEIISMGTFKSRQFGDMKNSIFRAFDLNSNISEFDGLAFSIHRMGKHWVFEFYIQELKERRRPSIKITMEPDINHEKPHIHLSRQHNHHFASIGLDGQIIHGEALLNRDEKRALLDWLKGHGIALRKLWDCVKDGRPDYQKYIERVNNSWEYEGLVFDGPQPSNHTVINGISVWYDGELSQSKNGNISTLFSTGRMCIIAPTNETGFLKQWQFNSGVDAPQIRFQTK